MGKKRKAIKGRTVNVHYVGTFDDGTEFDNSRNRGEAITFEVGAGQMIQGFDSAIDGMTIGETKTVTLTPDEAYGQVDPNAFQTVPEEMFENFGDLNTGQTVTGVAQNGEQFAARIHSLQENTVTLDFNHPMAGKNLNFEVELVSVE